MIIHTCGKNDHCVINPCRWLTKRIVLHYLSFFIFQETSKSYIFEGMIVVIYVNNSEKERIHLVLIIDEKRAVLGKWTAHYCALCILLLKIGTLTRTWVKLKVQVSTAIIFDFTLLDPLKPWGEMSITSWKRDLTALSHWHSFYPNVRCVRHHAYAFKKASLHFVV